MVRLRKISLIIVIVFVTVGFSACIAQRPTPTSTPTATKIGTQAPTDTLAPTPSLTPEPTIEPTATPRSGPTVVGIYVSGSGGRVLLEEYVCSWVRGTDIALFNTFASNEPLLKYAAYRVMLVDCWFGFPDAKDYKIGYQLKYTLVSGEEITVTITSPEDITHTEYLEVYMYDSVLQAEGGGWYSHLLEKDMSDETLLYSFKLTPGVKIAEVKDIRLKSFVYKYQDDSDFDPDTGEYIGTISYEIDIKRKE